eukprot:CAMPEP_0196598568 /NCGR_PEP_ID=MMETSP1081-20130531/94391_1 /TAXON_ID=36882 /ORGANISM="Pyramimonas amylifera, Strain CCMP720" /LENGTH=124 /DNA_ID=CAMNT_0041924277 /DNA_START=910 /DNA_END=1284 /DNA_ORIENTATION=+
MDYSNAAVEGVSSVSVLEANELLAANYFYLDVRTMEEFASGYVAGSVNVSFMNKENGAMTPNPAFMTLVEKIFPDKSTNLLLGCKSGKRALMAGAAMRGQGYSNMINADGGFDEWQAQGLPSTK